MALEVISVVAVLDRAAEELDLALVEVYLVAEELESRGWRDLIAVPGTCTDAGSGSCYCAGGWR